MELLALTEELRRSGALDDVGGAAYLSSLMDGVPRSLNVEYYARSHQGEGPPPAADHLLGQDHQPRATRRRTTPDELLDDAQAAIIDVAEQRTEAGLHPAVARSSARR